jgi:predicted nucleotidyltransferase
MIVEFNQMPLENCANNYFDFKFTLQNIPNRSVDLLKEQAIKNPYFFAKNKQHKTINLWTVK